MSAKSEVITWGIIIAALATAGYFGYRAVSGLFGEGGFMSGLLGGSEGVDLLGKPTKLDFLGNIPVGTQEVNLAEANQKAAASYSYNVTTLEDYQAQAGSNTYMIGLYQKYNTDLAASEVARKAIPSDPWGLSGRLFTGKTSSDYQAKYAAYLTLIQQANADYDTYMAEKARLRI